MKSPNKIDNQNQIRRIDAKMKVDKSFTPCPVDEEDELFPNGIFNFNITKMADYIQKNIDSFMPEKVLLKDFYISSNINESHLKSVDISRPIIIAEISPGRYNVIDGNHRIEKSRRLGKKYIRAYRFQAKQHIRFLTTQRAYLSFVEYWNSKLKKMVVGQNV